MWTHDENHVVFKQTKRSKMYLPDLIMVKKKYVLETEQSARSKKIDTGMLM